MWYVPPECQGGQDFAKMDAAGDIACVEKEESGGGGTGNYQVRK